MTTDESMATLRAILLPRLREKVTSMQRRGMQWIDVTITKDEGAAILAALEPAERPTQGGADANG